MILALRFLLSLLPPGFNMPPHALLEGAGEREEEEGEKEQVEEKAEEKRCRLCLEGEDDGPLVQPLRLWWEFASLVPAAHAAYDSKSVPADV